MNTYTVKELMVPISEYATVKEGATLYEAVLALEKAQADYDHTKYRHRAVLVLGKENRVVGKLSHMDVLDAVQAQTIADSGFTFDELSDFGFSIQFASSLLNQGPLSGISLEDLCKSAAKQRVEDYMQSPTAGEYVSPEASLELAIRQMVTGLHLSLLVAEADKKIVGILRLSDAFAAIFHVMKNSVSDKE